MNMQLDDKDVEKIVAYLRQADDNELVVMADVLKTEFKRLKTIESKSKLLINFVQLIPIDETRTTYRFAKGFRKTYLSFLEEFPE